MQFHSDLPHSHPATFTCTHNPTGSSIRMAHPTCVFMEQLSGLTGLKSLLTTSCQAGTPAKYPCQTRPQAHLPIPLLGRYAASQALPLKGLRLIFPTLGRYDLPWLR